MPTTKERMSVGLHRLYNILFWKRLRGAVVDFVETLGDKVRDMKCFLYKSGRFCKRVVIWIPVLWRDEDWSYCYLYEIMAFKVKQMRKHLKTFERHYSCPRNMKNMLIFENLLKRSAGHHDYLIKNPFAPCSCKEMYIDEKGCWHTGLCDTCTKYWNKICRQKEEQEFQYMCELLRKRSRRWWD